MNWQEIFSGNAGPVGLQWALNGAFSRRLLRGEVQKMLRSGYRAGPFHLTRAKFKPGRKLLAYFTFPALDSQGRTNHPLHLAVAWENNLDGDARLDSWSQLEEEANRSGLMPVEYGLWRDLPERGMRLQLWPFDPEFPQLIRLGTPSYVAEMFAALGISGDLQQLPIVSPIRYRPGERHVLRYEIHSTDIGTNGRRWLYAKLYSATQDTARALGVANRVVDWLNTEPQSLHGVRPVALSQEDRVIFYPHVDGIPLSHELHRAGRWLGAQLQTIGRGLALLHRGPETLQSDLRQNTFSNEAKVVKRASEHIQVLLPETYNKILKILDQAQERYFVLPQEKPTFTHADFKSDHLLVTPQGLTLIDFDTCTLTDPALDLGKFLADLEWWFMLKGISGIEEAQAELLKGYVGDRERDQQVDERLRRARFFHVLILVKIVARRVPLYDKEWSAITARMIERAAHLLDNTTVNTS